MQYIYKNTDHPSSGNSLQTVSGAICGYDVPPIDPLQSNLGIDNHCERSLRSITKPGTSIDGNFGADHNKRTHTVNATARDLHFSTSDESSFYEVAPSVESPFLPQCFFDVGPYDTRVSPNDSSAIYPESIVNGCSSPILPESFFDSGPYDLEGLSEQGFT